MALYAVQPALLHTQHILKSMSADSYRMHKGEMENYKSKKAASKMLLYGLTGDYKDGVVILFS